MKAERRGQPAGWSPDEDDANGGGMNEKERESLSRRETVVTCSQREGEGAEGNGR